jgi:hypothetical protein
MLWELVLGTSPPTAHPNRHRTAAGNTTIQARAAAGSHASRALQLLAHLESEASAAVKLLPPAVPALLGSGMQGMPWHLPRSSAAWHTGR